VPLTRRLLRFRGTFSTRPRWYPDLGVDVQSHWFGPDRGLEGACRCPFACPCPPGVLPALQRLYTYGGIVRAEAGWW